MEVANTLAYYGTATIIAVKGFIVQAQGVEIKHGVLKWMEWRQIGPVSTKKNLKKENWKKITEFSAQKLVPHLSAE